MAKTYSFLIITWLFVLSFISLTFVYLKAQVTCQLFRWQSCYNIKLKLCGIWKSCQLLRLQSFCFTQSQCFLFSFSYVQVLSHWKLFQGWMQSRWGKQYKVVVVALARIWFVILQYCMFWHFMSGHVCKSELVLKHFSW